MDIFNGIGKHDLEYKYVCLWKFREVFQPSALWREGSISEEASTAAEWWIRGDRQERRGEVRSGVVSRASEATARTWLSL